MKKHVQTIVTTTNGTYTSDVSKILFDEDDLITFKEVCKQVKDFKSFALLIAGNTVLLNPTYIVAIEIKELESNLE